MKQQRHCGKNPKASVVTMPFPVIAKSPQSSVLPVSARVGTAEDALVKCREFRDRGMINIEVIGTLDSVTRKFTISQLEGLVYRARRALR
jgi:hypothetical protein